MKPEAQEEYVNEVRMENGTTVLFSARTSRGHRQFDLTLYLEKWEAPQTIAQYLEIYAEMLAAKRAVVNNIESLES